MGDNLRGSLDKVTNVEAFEGGAGSASWGHDLALLRLLKVSTKYFTLVLIHSKNWIRWIPESADNLEFSAERLSENAKNINSATC